MATSLFKLQTATWTTCQQILQRESVPNINNYGFKQILILEDLDSALEFDLQIMICLTNLHVRTVFPISKTESWNQGP